MISGGVEPPASSMSNWRASRCSTRSSVQPAGVEPTSARVSDGYLAARPRLETSALYGTRTRLSCSTDRSPHPLRHRALSKDGRSRTLTFRRRNAVSDGSSHRERHISRSRPRRVLYSIPCTPRQRLESLSRLGHDGENPGMLDGFRHIGCMLKSLCTREARQSAHSDAVASFPWPVQYFACTMRDGKPSIFLDPVSSYAAQP